MIATGDPYSRARFDATVMPHLQAAYNLARWLTRNEHDAQDVVQSAMLRACRYFAGFDGREPRAWLLTIVRNEFYTQAGLRQDADRLDALAANELALQEADPAPTPLLALERMENVQIVRKLLAALPVHHREVLILRDMEEFTYEQIAKTIGVPTGTVMSRLARARRQLMELAVAAGLGQEKHE